MKKMYVLILSVFLFGSVLSRAQDPGTLLNQIMNQVSLDSLMQDVEWLSGVDSVTVSGSRYLIRTRNADTEGNAKAAQYILERFEAYGLNSYFTTFQTDGQNVIGEQTGTLYPNQKFIICAHYDDMPGGTVAPGADDNASGTAAVIEAARILSQYEFPYTIVYALWDEEELGLIGSYYYASEATAAGDSIKGVVNMDMITWEEDDNDLVQVHTSSQGNSTSLVIYPVLMNTLLDLGLTLQIVDPGTQGSDHASFWDFNFTAIGITEDYNNDFNGYYHTVNDKTIYFDQPYYFKVSKLAISSFVAAILNLYLSIEHTPIASVDSSMAITTYAKVLSGFTIGEGSNAPILYYRTATAGSVVWGPLQPVSGVLIDGVNRYQFDIPAIELGSMVQYYIAAQDSAGVVVVTSPEGGSGTNPPGSTPPSVFYQFYVAHSEVVILDPADNTDNWTISGGWNTTAAKYHTAPYSFNESPAGSYPDGATYTMLLKDTVDLGGDILGANVSFFTQWNIEEGYDYVQLQAKPIGSGTWTSLSGKYTTLGSGGFQPNGQPLYDGVQSSWVQEDIDLLQFANQRIQLRFIFKSDNGVTADGFFFDDFTVAYYTGGEPTSVDDAVPSECSLEQNYPNPFNPSTVISFSLPSRQHVELAVYDILGNRVALLFEGEKGAGKHTVSFDASDLASGIYFYRLRTDETMQTRKMILMK